MTVFIILSSLSGSSVYSPANSFHAYKSVTENNTLTITGLLGPPTCLKGVFTILRALLHVCPAVGLK